MRRDPRALSSYLFYSGGVRSLSLLYFSLLWPHLPLYVSVSLLVSPLGFTLPFSYRRRLSVINKIWT